MVKNITDATALPVPKCSVYTNLAGKYRDSEIDPTEYSSVIVGGNSDSRFLWQFIILV